MGKLPLTLKIAAAVKEKQYALVGTLYYYLIYVLHDESEVYQDRKGYWFPPLTLDISYSLQDRCFIECLKTLSTVNKPGKEGEELPYELFNKNPVLFIARASEIKTRFIPMNPTITITPPDDHRQFSPVYYKPIFLF